MVVATRGSAFPCQPTTTGVLKFTPVDIWRRPFREILPRIYISMSSWCVQGYPIGRVKRIKGGRTTNLFSFRLVHCRFLVLLSPRIHKRARVCGVLRVVTLNHAFLQAVINHPFVSAHEINSVFPPPPPPLPFRVRGLSGSGFFGKNYKRGYNVYITGNGTWDLGLEGTDLKVEDLSPFVSGKDWKTVSSLYILRSSSNAISTTIASFEDHKEDRRLAVDRNDWSIFESQPQREPFAFSLFKEKGKGTAKRDWQLEKLHVRCWIIFR